MYVRMYIHMCLYTEYTYVYTYIYIYLQIYIVIAGPPLMGPPQAFLNLGLGLSSVCMDIYI